MRETDDTIVLCIQDIKRNELRLFVARINKYLSKVQRKNGNGTRDKNC